MGPPTSGADLGVYVHVPFCDRVCPYCDFAVEAVGKLDAELERRYLDLLAREFELVLEQESGLEGRRLETVYLGGGTPSLVSPKSVERLLGLLRSRLDGEPREVTLELNPGTLEVERVPGFRAAGVTRLSVGVQSLQALTLRRLGRAHRADEALRGLEVCLAAGLASVSADLIFGAPDQSEEALYADLERLIDLGVPHLSLYGLTCEPGTPFHAARERGRLRLPSEDAVLRMSRGLRARLAAAGYEHYEISNFARPGHRSLHNQRYWLRRDVLGLGVSAASLLGRRRLKNSQSRPAWERGLVRGQRPLEEVETLLERDARRETLYLGLRLLEGVSRSGYLRRFGEAPERQFGAELAELRELELVADRGGSLRLTDRGIRFADEVFLRFVGR